MWWKDPVAVKMYPRHVAFAPDSRLKDLRGPSFSDTWVVTSCMTTGCKEEPTLVAFASTHTVTFILFGMAHQSPLTHKSQHALIVAKFNSRLPRHSPSINHAPTTHSNALFAQLLYGNTTLNVISLALIQQLTRLSMRLIMHWMQKRSSQ